VDFPTKAVKFVMMKWGLSLIEKERDYL